MSEPEARHRLAAILAADAAGYSRVMADDDRVALATLDAARLVFRKHIEAQGGRVIDTAGDSVLASFETATGAVRAAVAIQRKLSTPARGKRNAALSFRIGVHIGDVLEKADGSVYGDGVNIAARLQALCEPGGLMSRHPNQYLSRGRRPLSPNLPALNPSRRRVRRRLSSVAKTTL